jgi:hypothetical protein
VLQLLGIVNVVHSSLILSTLMLEAICSYEMPFLTRATRRHIQEDGILISHRLEERKSYLGNGRCKVLHLCMTLHSNVCLTGISFDMCSPYTWPQTPFSYRPFCENVEVT